MTPKRKNQIQSLKRYILEENIGFPLWNGTEMILVIADQHENAIREASDEKGWSVNIQEYKIPVEEL